MKSFFSVLFLFSCFIGPAARAVAEEGTTALSSLDVPIHARATALAGALTAERGDAALFDYNPAGLVYILRTHLQASYINYLEDSSLQSVSIAFPLPGKDSFLTPDGYRADPTTLGFHYRGYKVEDTRRNNIGVRLDDFAVRDRVLQASAAHALSRRTAVGVSAKIAAQDIDDKSRRYVLFDAGLSHQWNRHWQGGVAVVNAGSSKALDREKDPPPTRWRAGAHYRSDAWKLFADLSVGRDDIVKKSLGSEWDLGRYVQLRAGTFHDTDIQFTGGLGLRIRGPEKATWTDPGKGKKDSSALAYRTLDFGVDYGLSTHPQLGITHTLTIKILY